MEILLISLPVNMHFKIKYSVLKMYGFYFFQNSLKRKETDCRLHRLVIPKSYFGLCSVIINYVYGFISRSVGNT